jgi:hypothetical protein
VPCPLWVYTRTLLEPCGIDDPRIDPSNSIVWHSKEVAAVRMISDQQGDTDANVARLLGFVEEQAVGDLVWGMSFMCRINPRFLFLFW